MRNILALITGGVAAGISLGVMRLLDFSPAEMKLLPWIVGALAWSAVRYGGKGSGK